MAPLGRVPLQTLYGCNRKKTPHRVRSVLLPQRLVTIAKFPATMAAIRPLRRRPTYKAAWHSRSRCQNHNAVRMQSMCLGRRPPSSLAGPHSDALHRGLKDRTSAGSLPNRHAGPARNLTFRCPWYSGQKLHRQRRERGGTSVIRLSGATRSPFTSAVIAQRTKHAATTRWRLNGTYL